MTEERMDVLSFKKTQNGKYFTVRLGSATPNKDGDGWNLWLDAIPASIDGQYRLSMVPPREKTETRASHKAANRQTDDLDDEMPF